MNLFQTLVATPGDLGDSVVMPAGGMLYASSDAEIEEPTLLIGAGSRELGVAAGAAGAQHCLGWFETGVAITKHGDALGTVSLYVQGPSGVRHKIAEG